MSSRWIIRPIATALLLTLGFGVPAQAKSRAAGAASPRQGDVLEQLTACGASLLRALKDTYPWCGTGYCPTPPGPPPPGHTMSSVVFKPLGKGSLP